MRPLPKSIILFVFLLACGVSTVWAEAPGEAIKKTPGQTCDNLAAHPDDPKKPAEIEGTRSDAIKADLAIEACTMAIKQEPAAVRYRYELGRAYFAKSDYSAAFREFSIAAKRGYAAAKGELAYLHDQGLGTAVDKKKAFSLYAAAAGSDVGFAAHKAGVMLREGIGTRVDHDKSLLYFRKAVSLGHKPAEADIGFAYDRGYGVAVDYKEAMSWYLKAAEDGHAEATNNIGVLYQSGHGVAQNFGEALAWYKKAQVLGFPVAYLNMAQMIDNGRGVTADPRSAADNALEALRRGDAAKDAFHIEYMFDHSRWSPGFWREIQSRLAASGHFTGAMDGEASPETRAALEVFAR